MLKILVISDTHSTLYANSHVLDKIISYEPFDVLFTLGDISEKDYKTLFEKLNNKPSIVAGVLGNHDFRTSLLDAGIENMNTTAIKVNDYTIAGFQGSFDDHARPDDTLRMNQNRSIYLQESIPNADILISHSNMFTQSINERHVGLAGLTEYLRTHKNTFLHIHGHLHENKMDYYIRFKTKLIHIPSFVTRYKSMYRILKCLFPNIFVSVCVYKWAVITVQDSKVINIIHY